MGPGGGEEGGALRGRDVPLEPQSSVIAVRTSQTRALRGGRRVWRRDRGGEEELQPAQEVPSRRMEKAERADAVKTLRGHVLKEPAQELMRRQRHGAALMIEAAAICEGDVAVVDVEDGLVRRGGAMDVAAEVLEDLVVPLDRRLGEDDPRLCPRDFRVHDARQGAAREG